VTCYGQCIGIVLHNFWRFLRRELFTQTDNVFYIKNSFYFSVEITWLNELPFKAGYDQSLSGLAIRNQTIWCGSLFVTLFNLIFCGSLFVTLFNLIFCGSLLTTLFQLPNFYGSLWTILFQLPNFCGSLLTTAFSASQFCGSLLTTRFSDSQFLWFLIDDPFVTFPILVPYFHIIWNCKNVYRKLTKIRLRTGTLMCKECIFSKGVRVQSSFWSVFWLAHLMS